MHALTLPVIATLSGLVLLGWITGPRRESRARPRLEMRWAVAAGVLFGVLSTWLLSGLHITGPACTPDFFEYCQALLYLDGSHQVFPSKRSRAAALLPAFFADKAGVLDGLAMAGVFCACVTGASLFVWARLLGGRCAGIVCIGVAMAMAPMVALPRFLAFYPEICASLCLAAAGTTAAILQPERRNRMALAGAGIGLCLLMDQRALLWALPFLGGVTLASLHAAGDSREKAIRFGLLLIPLVISYLLGSMAYGADAASLEAQIDIRPLFYQHGVTAPGFEPPHIRNSDYIWGRSSPLEIPATLQFIWEQRQLGDSVSSPLPPAEPRIRAHHEAWAAVLQVGALFSLITLFRKPRTLLTLAVTTLPFWMFFRSIGDMAEATPRFYTHALPGVAIIVAVGVGAALQQLPRRPVLSLPGWCRATVFVGVVMALVMGWIPSWMAPDASWRSSMDCWNKPLTRLPEFHGADPSVGRPQVDCAESIYGDGSHEKLPLRVFNGF
jgi:hypothetical protein